MKKTLRYAAAAVAALAALACSKEDAANPGTPENPDTTTPYTITASIDDGPDTRITMDDDGRTKIALKWKKGDKIYVVNNETGSPIYPFTAQSVSADGKTADFSAPANYSGTPTYAAHYGFSSITMLELKNIATYYSYVKNLEILPNYFNLYARYDAGSRRLVFKPLHALLKLVVTLPQEAQGDLGTLNLTSSDGSTIFYKGAYDITQDPFARTSTYMVNKLPYYVKETISIASGETASLYLLVHPGTELAGKSITITLPVGGVSYTTTIKGGNLEVGKCYPLTLRAEKWTQVQ